MNSFHETLRVTAHALISPVHAVVGFFAPWEKEPTSPSPKSPYPAPTVKPTAQSDLASNISSSRHRAANQAQYSMDRSVIPTYSRRKVRVVRVADAAIPATAAGRMVISGRLSEVCAELERLSGLNAMADRTPEVA